MKNSAKSRILAVDFHLFNTILVIWMVYYVLIKHINLLYFFFRWKQCAENARGKFGGKCFFSNIAFNEKKMNENVNEKIFN